MSSQSEQKPSRCWSCHGQTARGDIFCEHCNQIQPPDPRQTHFERFELEQKFTLDLDALTKAFRRAQRATHPDRFVSATDRERRFALEQSTIMNDAYRILKAPMMRAGYLLKLSPDFLITVMELRESLDELEGPDAHVERQRIKQSVALEYEEGITRLGTRLDSTTKPDGNALLVLAQLHAQLKYLRRTLEEIERLEAEGDAPDSGNLTRLDPLRPGSLERKGS